MSVPEPHPQLQNNLLLSVLGLGLAVTAYQCRGDTLNRDSCSPAVPGEWNSGNTWELWQPGTKPGAAASTAAVLMSPHQRPQCVLSDSQIPNQKLKNTFSRNLGTMSETHVCIISPSFWSENQVPHLGICKNDICQTMLT